MQTNLNIKIPEELNRRVEAQAAAQGLSVNEVILHYLEEFATTSKTSGAVPVHRQRRSAKISDFDPAHKLTPEEVAESLLVLEKMLTLADEIGQRYSNQAIDAVELVREGRREL